MGSRNLKKTAVIIAPECQDVLNMTKSMDRQVMAVFCEDQQLVMGSDRAIFLNKKLDQANRTNDFYWLTDQPPIKPSTKRLIYR